MISFAITSHNEGRSLESLIVSFKGYEHDHEIVVLDDFSDDPTTLRILEFYSSDKSPVPIKLFKSKFNGDFAEHKNKLNSLCSGEWIFQLDADEIPSALLVENLQALISENPLVQMFRVPRLNTVDGITQRHIDIWRWKFISDPTILGKRQVFGEELEFLRNNNLIIKDDGESVLYKRPIIEWPDYQSRLYRNIPPIRWERKVHEIVTGFETYSVIPPDFDWSILHFKNIEKQEMQNALYDELQTQ